ncbi:MAG: ABC transporter permease DevC, partial [Cyanobacteria bacterium P01_F01_bin.153]
MTRDRPPTPPKFQFFAWDIPMAWLQLSYQKTRFILSSMGISSAILLMFVQLGFLGALDEGNTVMHRHLRADLVMLHAKTEAMVLASPFSRRRLYQLLNFDAVERVTPIYLETGSLRNSEDGRSRTIAVYGINPIDQPFNFPDVDRDIKQIHLTDTVLFDRNSRPEYGPIAEDFDAGKDIAIELNRRGVKVGGAVNFTGTSFGITGNLITSDTNFSRFFPEFGNLERIALGAIYLKPDSKPESIVKSLRKSLPDDVQVLTIPEFIKLEHGYWQKTTAVGFIFQMGAAVGFLIGMYIVYQVLFTDVSNHIPDYAVLKAKGYPG